VPSRACDDPRLDRASSGRVGDSRDHSVRISLFTFFVVLVVFALFNVFNLFIVFFLFTLSTHPPTHLSTRPPTLARPPIHPSTRPPTLVHPTTWQLSERDRCTEEFRRLDSGDQNGGHSVGSVIRSRHRSRRPHDSPGSSSHSQRCLVRRSGNLAIQTHRSHHTPLEL
jgi:hypothetical protein